MIRIVPVLLLLASPILLAQQVDQQDAQQGNAGRGQQPSPQIEIAIPAEITSFLEEIVSNTAPNENAQQAEQAYNNESLNIGQSDLIQQKRMAIGTIAMAIFALVGTVTGVVGVVYLVKTFQATEKAATSALAAAMAAEGANEVARNIGEAQVRAYPSISVDEIQVMVSQRCFKLKFTCLNTGQSPLTDALLTIETYIGDTKGFITHALGSIPAGASIYFHESFKKLSIPDYWDGIPDEATARLRFMVSGTDVFDKNVSAVTDLVARPRGLWVSNGVIGAPITNSINTIRVESES